jgi:hypothetical protein
MHRAWSSNGPPSSFRRAPDLYSPSVRLGLMLGLAGAVALITILL